MLLVVIFTAINILLLVTNSGSYFLFSAYIPYLLVDLGMLLSGKYPAEYYAEYFPDMEFLSPTVFVVLLVLAVILVALYLVSWIMLKSPGSAGWSLRWCSS